MNRSDWRRFQGDANDTILVDLGGIVDLLGATSAEAVVWRTTEPVSSITLPATIGDTSQDDVLVSLGSWISTAALGIWKVAVRVTATWSDGSTGSRTFPGGYLWIDAVGT